MRTLKPYSTLLLILILILGISVSPVHLLFDREFLAGWLTQMGYRAVISYLLLLVGATMVGLPATILTLAGGIVFGLTWGTIWSVIGATGGAVGAFWLSRSLLHDLTLRWFGQHQLLIWLNRMVTGNPFWVVFFVRFAPISPFNLVNYLFGLTRISVWPYALGTFLGIMPGTFLYVCLGVTGDAALHGENPWPFLMALSLLGGLSLLPLIRRYWQRR
jgi:uncharacterized membrane protein YdjX (TVP38/TMEM64 family)